MKRRSFFVGAVLFGACSEPLDPTQMIDVSDVPRALSEKDCSEGTALQNEQGTRSCIDETSQKKHGPSLQISEQGRVFEYFQQGEPTIYPWFINNEGQLDVEKSESYLRQDHSVEVLDDYLKRNPNDQIKRQIVARLIAAGTESGSRLFSQEASPCSDHPEDMTCVEGGTVVQKVTDNGIVHFRAYWNNRFYVDKRFVTEDLVRACQEDCRCPEGDWNDWTVAEAYCTQDGKRLLTESELWMVFQKADVASLPRPDGYEWTQDYFNADVSPFHVLMSPSSQCLSDCSVHTAIHPKGSRKSSVDNPSFRCATSEPKLLKRKDFPYPIDKLPEIERSEEMGRYSWAHENIGFQRSLGESPAAEIEFEYKDLYMLTQQLWAYHTAYPEYSKLYILGETHLGNPIIALRVTDNPTEDEGEPSILIDGGHHGYQLLSVLYAMGNLDYLFKKAPKQWLENFDFWFVPMVNPDGNFTTLYRDARGMRGRKNGRNTDGQCSISTKEGVDLNRNYPFKWFSTKERGSKSKKSSQYYRGSKAGSEPETQAIMRLATRYHFVANLSWHTHGTMILYPYTAPRLRNPQPDVALIIAETLSEKAGKQHNQKKFAVRKSRYTVDGTSHDWLYHRFGTLSYSIKGIYHNPTKIQERKSAIRGGQPIFSTLVQRLDSGPSVYGYVTNKKGEPLTATIEVKGYMTYEGEEWQSRSLDGRYHRVLLDQGSYDLIYRAEGYQTLRQTCEVKEEPSICNATLLQSIPR
ncbi:MAG: M14 family zinc carboxypeptidase [Myxococcota bacterium]|nr:M14 family zinc carboxypeptidase [Myxococcota bacterium]